ncbi:hypothetical protein BLNAU_3461 [Blattamonas nauphoetae]|uniref:Uncharacterized protein n=1 Tax=Blattamonas nauphoetae TaxID=2049346 RepID=A0ABQ9YD21_9EUKA|nr:hypothetical protein BLNAU_3461 [Blattamonas nauphoetae]
MEEESAALNKTNDFCLNHFPEPRWSIDTFQEPFLYSNTNSELSFDDKSSIYNSLVALVKTKYPFGDPLQDKVIRFLKSLGPQWGRQDQANQMVTDLVPSSGGSTSGFIDSIVVLLSSPHSTVVDAALSFLFKTLYHSSPAIQDCLVESDLISNVLATVQPHTLPISGNEEIFDKLVNIIQNSAILASPLSLFGLGVTAAVEKSNHREMILQKVVIPSSQFVTFLISNRYILNELLLNSFMALLCAFLEMGPFHRPTLEFVLASPVAMGFSDCLSFIEYGNCLRNILINITLSLEKWKREGPEVSQSGKRMLQALFSEGFEDTLEQMIRKKNKGYGSSIDEFCHSITQLLGLNVKRQ